MKPEQSEQPLNAAARLLPFATVLFFIALFFGASSVVSAQDVAETAAHSHDSQSDFALWFGILELPFLFLCVYFAFRTAAALRGGIFGNGMAWMAWGFLIMAVGHLNMQLDHFFGFNLFRDLLGHSLGTVLWFIALVATWSARSPDNKTRSRPHSDSLTAEYRPSKRLESDELHPPIERA
ncbi:MAG: hypothetical protein AAGB22_10270, partial [Bacteroidota bacterium]